MKDISNEDYSRYSILIVDDIPVNILLVQSMLSKMKFQIFSANSGQEALDMVKKSNPNIILMDVMMPGMNGFEVTRELKNNPDTQNIPVIIISALNSDSDVKEGLAAGANDFITKPFIQERVVNSILNQIKLVENEKEQKEDSYSQLPRHLFPVLSYLACSSHKEECEILKKLVVGMPISLFDQKLLEIIKQKKEKKKIEEKLLAWGTERFQSWQLQVHAVAVSDVVDEIIELLSPIATEKKISPTHQLEKRVNIKTDLELCRAILKNLIVAAYGVSAAGKVSVDEKMEETLLTINVMGKKKSLTDETWNLNLSLAKEMAEKMNAAVWTTPVDKEDFHFQLVLPDIE